MKLPVVKSVVTRGKKGAKIEAMNNWPVLPSLEWSGGKGQEEVIPGRRKRKDRAPHVQCTKAAHGGSRAKEGTRARAEVGLQERLGCDMGLDFLLWCRKFTSPFVT